MKRNYLIVLLGLANVSIALDTPLHMPYAPDIERIVEQGELRVAMYSGIVPHFMSTDAKGITVGFDVQVAQAIADQLKVKLHIDQASTFDGVAALVAERKDDIAVSNLSATPDRALSVDFSQAYYVMPQALLVKQNFIAKNLKVDQEIVSTASLRIAVAADSSYVYYAKLAFPRATIVTYATLNDAVKNLKQGQYDAVFSDALSIKQVMSTEKALSALNLGKVHVDPLSIAVSITAPHLLSWLNVYLNSLEVQTAMPVWKAQAQLP